MKSIFTSKLMSSSIFTLCSQHACMTIFFTELTLLIQNIHQVCPMRITIILLENHNHLGQENKDGKQTLKGRVSIDRAVAIIRSPQKFALHSKQGGASRQDPHPSDVGM
eukprot:TRINITY_DN60506_c0_g1_i1.p1 TRINITY_DN60506_c0_g1~~TRINITY_DN60506_c0_g1_i1.p1  ORF type:complete len:109 (+),score=9.05 TRINITY_DN60506_c0_g1_i1:295-621(+)